MPNTMGTNRITINNMLSEPMALHDEPPTEPSRDNTVSYNDGVLRVGDVTYQMIHVAAGSFIMGATHEQQNPSVGEKPAHIVKLTNDYYLGETEVTQGLWRAVMGLLSFPMLVRARKTNLGILDIEIFDNIPVTDVSWDDCQEFIRRLNVLTGCSFRLPTEAEWEYAARGGCHSCGYQYAGSDNLDDVAWYGGTAYTVLPRPVKYKLPNELGLYDMSGNVWEWCHDGYREYSSDSQTNPTGPTGDYGRVRRGGSFWRDAFECRVAFREASATEHRNFEIGFRLAISE